jgi:hypothetical protein
MKNVTLMLGGKKVSERDLRALCAELSRPHPIPVTHMDLSKNALTDAVLPHLADLLVGLLSVVSVGCALIQLSDLFLLSPMG